MYNFLPKTADTYENAIRCYYFAVCTCRQIDESELQGTDSCYYKDFWRDDLKVNIKAKIKSRDNDRLQKTYKELSRLIFLPFLYGYEWSVTIKTPIYGKIMFDLIKVSEGAIPTPSDIKEIVKAMMEVSDSFHNPDTNDSPYLREKIDEFVKLYNARTDVMKNKRKEVLSTFTSFKKKQQRIDSDPDLSMYLQVFMDTVTSSYRIAEMMKSGKLQKAKAKESTIVKSLK